MSNKRVESIFKASIWLVGLAGGLIGGLASFAVINYFCEPKPDIATSDAVAIANTYIVFTTFVIAVVALVLTVAGLIFTQHFALQKEEHMNHAFEAMLRVLGDNDEKAEKLVIHIMNNIVVQDKVAEDLNGKISELLQQKLELAKSAASKAAQEAANLDDLAGSLSK